MKKENLELQSISNPDYILYFDQAENIGYEIQFNENTFNGKIHSCNYPSDENGGDGLENWEEVKNRKLFHDLKNQAEADYKKLFLGGGKNEL